MGGGRLSAHFGPMFTTAQHTLQRSSTDPLSQSMKARFRQQSYGGTCCKTYVGLSFFFHRHHLLFSHGSAVPANGVVSSLGL